MENLYDMYGRLGISRAALNIAKEAETVLEQRSPLSGKYPDFSGWVAYEQTFESKAEEKTVLELTEVYETAEVFVNGVSAGRVIAPPYRFDLTELIKDGENTLRIEVATTLERAVAKIQRETKDPMAGFVFDRREAGVLHPYGLLGTATLYVE